MTFIFNLVNTHIFIKLKLLYQLLVSGYITSPVSLNVCTMCHLRVIDWNGTDGRTDGRTGVTRNAASGEGSHDDDDDGDDSRNDGNQR